MSEKWVVEYNKEGEPIRWTPWEQHIAGQFLNSIVNRTLLAPLLWGSPKVTDKEEIWKIAQEEYQQFKDELPISYLEYYNHNNP